ncbi:hypothetical protein ACHAQH_001386 [Verticillium albo-atrum]
MADTTEQQQQPAPAEEAPTALPPINEAVAAIIEESQTGASTPTSIGAQSDHDILSKKVTLADLTAKATAMYARKEYDDAAEVFAAAAELQANINGEENQPDNAEILFLYGRTLFKVGQTKSDVLGGQASGKKVEKPRPKAPKEAPTQVAPPPPEAASTEKAKTEQQKVTQGGLAAVAEETSGAKKAETVDNKKPLFQFDGDENFEDSDDEVAEGEGDEDGEEEVDDLQAAFDILEMARISLEKSLEQVTQQESEDPSKGKEVSEGDSGIVRHIKERLADTHDLLAEISLENERFPAAVRDSRISLQFKKELYPQESEIIAEAHFKLSLALEFASATTTQEDGAAEGEQAPFDEKLREEAITELEAAIQSTKLKLQAKEVELAEMANPEENVATKAQISDVRDIIEDMEQRLTEMRKPQVDIKAALEAAAGTAMQGIMGSALGESAADTEARVEEAKKNATDLTGLVRKKKKDEAQPAEQTNGNGSNGTKRKAEEPAESDESAKKAKVAEEAV